MLPSTPQSSDTAPSRPVKRLTSFRTATAILIAILAVNQWMIGNVSMAMGGHSSMAAMRSILRVQEASATTIIMPMLNADGKTTSLTQMPTITEVSGEPSGDAVSAAKTVMLAHGAPFYAQGGESFDDPVTALSLWGSHERDALSAEMEARYKDLTGRFPCNFCCGSPTSVTLNGRCGCAHAKAARGFFRSMLATYGDTYTNEELMGEAYRWQSVWYPSGVVEDYLLATGRGDVILHKTHGGAGADGKHGL